LKKRSGKAMAVVTNKATTPRNDVLADRRPEEYAELIMPRE